MDSLDIYDQASELVKKHNTRDPIELAECLELKIYDVDDLTELLGMYTYNWGHGIILMNPNVNEILYKMVLCHEIGHHLRHREIAEKGALKEFDMFNMTNITEYEANASASHIIIDENEMLDLFKNGYDIFSAAKMLKVNPNLLLIKMQEMNKLGMNLKIPYNANAVFLKDTKY